MEVNSNQTPGIGLPRPSAGGDDFVSAKPGETLSYGGMAPSPPGPALNAQAHAPVSAPADDSNDLDQEWVDRAKDIVEKTKSDPFAESREISKVKAAYLKARYNKEFKVHEDSA
jgi:hypothetical protein